MPNSLPLYCPDNDTLLDIGQLGDIGKGKATCPLVHHLHQAKVEGVNIVSDRLQEAAVHLALANPLRYCLV